MRAGRVGAMGALIALSLGGCSLSRGDRRLAAGDAVGAAQAYQRAAEATLSTADRAARASLRLGVLHALPDSPLYDAAEARRIFERLAARHPGSPYAREAGLLLASLEVPPPAPSSTEAAVEEEPVPPASASEGELRDALHRERERARGLDQRVSSLSAEAERLRDEIDRLEAELEQLKAIDLAEPPR